MSRGGLLNISLTKDDITADSIRVMPDTRSMPARLPALTERPVYPAMRRMRRAILRRLGRWSRGAYDVRLVYDQGKPIYKKVVFNSNQQARRVAGALSAFGESIHVPTLRHQADNAIWVDYVAGHAFDPHAADQPRGMAECLTSFALRPSRAVALGEAGLVDESHQRLAWLLDQAVITPRLGETLRARLNGFDTDLMLRFGFDYADPIAANLLTRADTGQVCAIDVKNVRQDALVGLGVAKAHARWLDDDGLDRILADWQSHGLADVVTAFDFIRLYERIERVARQAVTEKRSRGAIRKQSNKANKLEALLD